MNREKPGEKRLTIRELYPQLNEEELKEADENLTRYLEVVLDIYTSIRSEPQTYVRFKALTEKNRKL